MPKFQVFACLDAISNRYGREAAAYDKEDDSTIDFDAKPNPQKLAAMGINVVNS